MKECLDNYGNRFYYIQYIGSNINLQEINIFFNKLNVIIHENKIKVKVKHSPVFFKNPSLEFEYNAEIFKVEPQEYILFNVESKTFKIGTEGDFKSICPDI